MSKFKLEQENFFTKEQCQEMIALSEQKGFEEAKIMTRNGEVMNKDVRDNDRVVFDDKDLAERLYPMVKDLIPTDIDWWVPIGLNERFRFYRYKDGQQFKPHPDGSFKRSPVEQSKITMMIYLNDEFDGGGTEFIYEKEIIQPKTGKLLLFRHGMMHSGLPVSNGIKYVLRTDIMYKLNGGFYN